MQTASTPADIRCHRCAHYFITHHPDQPYGCQALGFKSRIEPSKEVFKASGEPCRFFNPHPRTTSRYR
ncbi:hypothetical protein DNK49_19760 [Azoarcus communis]|uniref:Uracil-DNA glycosylase n=1 Tax=Parazoarcus communis SWub3 = DSM 12120 TaxID=1121029 RepID=A0A323UQ83_9RHOO|nr:hypothetical protein DNK49_19760 [Azoarcus communis] [Parazoarcus communis SWub3 = DSM 12120]